MNLAVVLKTMDMIGLGEPRFYVPAVKILLSLLSLSLVVFAYKIAGTFGNRYGAVLAAIFTGFWYEMVYLAHKPLPDVLATYIFLGALVATIGKHESQRRAFVAGALMAAALVLRNHFLAAIGVLSLLCALRFTFREKFRAAAGFLLTVLVSGLFEWLFFAAPFFRSCPAKTASLISPIGIRNQFTGSFMVQSLNCSI